MVAHGICEKRKNGKISFLKYAYVSSRLQILRGPIILFDFARKLKNCL